jgi:hypothetical protein
MTQIAATAAANTNKIANNIQLIGPIDSPLHEHAGFRFMRGKHRSQDRCDTVRGRRRNSPMVAPIRITVRCIGGVALKLDFFGEQRICHLGFVARSCNRLKTGEGLDLGHDKLRGVGSPSNPSDFCVSQLPVISSVIRQFSSSIATARSMSRFRSVAMICRCCVAEATTRLASFM